MARQDCGTRGKVGNCQHCQLGVFLPYGWARGHNLVDKRLYLPPAWINYSARRRAAVVPEAIR